MRVLHLFSDHRWTGPAEPVVELVRGLNEMGIETTFACRRSPGTGESSVADKAAARGVPPVLDFALNRYLSPGDTVRDMMRLPKYLRERKFDIVHCHLTHDHAIGGWSARRADPRIRVIRTNHKGLPFKHGIWRRAFHRRYTDAYLGYSRTVAEEDKRNLGLKDEQVFVTNPSIDLARFDPDLAHADIRPKLGLAADDVVGAIVARVQRHRRWDVLLDAVKLALPRVPKLRVLVIGRGTHIDSVAKQPAARMGLNEHVLFPGYRSDDYVAFLAGIDFKIFLKQGSDGTCRAVREAMAMGKPVIAARRGMLPELVPHEQAGLIVDDAPQDLAEAIVRLSNDIELRERLGRGARLHAQQHFRLSDQVKSVAAMYEALLRGL